MAEVRKDKASDDLFQGVKVIMIPSGKWYSILAHRGSLQVKDIKDKTYRRFAHFGHTYVLLDSNGDMNGLTAHVAWTYLPTDSLKINTDFF